MKPEHRAAMIMIQREILRTGIAPTLDELRRAIGAASKSSVHRILTQLELNGFIKRDKQRTRAITILKPICEGFEPAVRAAIQTMGHEPTNENMNAVARAIANSLSAPKAA